MFNWRPWEGIAATRSHDVLVEVFIVEENFMRMWWVSTWEASSLPQFLCSPVCRKWRSFYLFVILTWHSRHKYVDAVLHYWNGVQLDSLCIPVLAWYCCMPTDSGLQTVIGSVLYVVYQDFELWGSACVCVCVCVWKIWQSSIWASL
jgi:hypothetical protein